MSHGAHAHCCCSCPTIGVEPPVRVRPAQPQTIGAVVRQAIITQVAGAKVLRKAVWLLQLLRPSLRSAVTANGVVSP